MKILQKYLYILECLLSVRKNNIIKYQTPFVVLTLIVLNSERYEFAKNADLYRLLLQEQFEKSPQYCQSDDTLERHSHQKQKG